MKHRKNNYLIDQIDSSFSWYSRLSLLVLLISPWLDTVNRKTNNYFEVIIFLVLMTLGFVATYNLLFSIKKFKPRNDDLNNELWEKIDLQGLLIAQIEIHSIFCSRAISSDISNIWLLPIIGIDLFSVYWLFANKKSKEKLFIIIYISYLIGLCQFFLLSNKLFDGEINSVIFWGVIPVWVCIPFIIHKKYHNFKLYKKE